MKNTAEPIKLQNFNMLMMNDKDFSNDAAASAALAAMCANERELAFVSVLVADEKSAPTGNGSTNDVAA